jgi:hypothetical protein
LQMQCQTALGAEQAQRHRSKRREDKGLRGIMPEGVSRVLCGMLSVLYSTGRVSTGMFTECARIQTRSQERS